MRIQIGNINIKNHSKLHAVAAKAGYAASIDIVNETSASIDLGDEAHRRAAGITISEVERMITSFICFGFSVKRA